MLKHVPWHKTRIPKIPHNIDSLAHRHLKSGYDSFGQAKGVTHVTNTRQSHTDVPSSPDTG